MRGSKSAGRTRRAGLVGLPIIAVLWAALSGLGALSSSSSSSSFVPVLRAARLTGPFRGSSSRCQTRVQRRISMYDLEQGQKVSGRVESVAPFGAFVDIGAERPGLVHISKVAEGRVEDIYAYVSEGQEVDVFFDRVTEDGKLALSMVESKVGGGGARAPREKGDLTPFANVGAEEWLTGTVINVANFGCFVAVTPKDGGAPAEGLVHITQIREGFVEDVSMEVQKGDEVQVRVLEVDPAAGRMSLSMKPMVKEETFDFEPFNKFVGTETWLEGKVERVAKFGLFVRLSTPEPEVSEAVGLVHVTQIRDGFVESVEDEAQVDDLVKVRVLEVDMENNKLSLSMKEKTEEGDGDEDF